MKYKVIAINIIAVLHITKNVLFKLSAYFTLIIAKIFVIMNTKITIGAFIKIKAPIRLIAFDKLKFINDSHIVFKVMVYPV
jgi:hypothetical protein